MFVKYLGTAHLNGRNVALYSNGTRTELRGETVGQQTVRIYGTKKFGSPEAAQMWFDGMPGSNNASKLASALEALHPWPGYDDQPWLD